MSKKRGKSIKNNPGTNIASGTVPNLQLHVYYFLGDNLQHFDRGESLKRGMHYMPYCSAVC